MVLLRRERQNVITTITTIPSSNLTVTESGQNRRVVVRRKERKSIRPRARGCVSSCDEDRQDGKGAKNENTQATTTDATADDGALSEVPSTIQIKLQENPTTEKSNSSKNALPKALPKAGRYLSWLVPCGKYGKRNLEEETVVSDYLPQPLPWNPPEQTENSGEGGSKKHVTFTKETILVDLHNKERKRQQEMHDPVLFVKRLLCQALSCPTQETTLDVKKEETKVAEF